jgi:MFS superfamily sulfate permease-like transporter
MSKMNIKSILKNYFPISVWLPAYKKSFIRWDLVAGIILASFVLPESMAYATLAGVPTYFGIYCCLAGGLFFALFTSSRQVAVGPTSSISLMIGSTVAVLSGGDPSRWAAIAELTALAVAAICLIAYIFKLSSIVNFISDSILLGFKAGAALSIMATQLPKIFGVEGGGSNFFTRIRTLLENMHETNWTVLIFGVTAMVILIAGDYLFKGKPVSLVVVIASILVMSFTTLAAAGVHITGLIPDGLPSLSRPSLRFRDVDGVLPLAFACFLMAYIESISAARTFAMKNNYTINPRQELISLGAANFAAAFSSAYVVAGGLSQSTVNDVALIAIVGVLVFGILKGVMISVIMSLILLIRRSSNPEVAVLGRIGDTGHFSDRIRHTDNILIPGIVIVRIESSILYFNTESILEKINGHVLSAEAPVKMLIIDLSASPYVDVAGSKMLLNLARESQKKGIQIRFISALSGVREILRKQGLEEFSGPVSRETTIAETISAFHLV